jgi:hypothetical protein
MFFCFISASPLFHPACRQAGAKQKRTINFFSFFGWEEEKKRKRKMIKYFLSLILRFFPKFRMITLMWFQRYCAMAGLLACLRPPILRKVISAAFPSALGVQWQTRQK